MNCVPMSHKQGSTFVYVRSKQLGLLFVGRKSSPVQVPARLFSGRLLINNHPQGSQPSKALLSLRRYIQHGCIRR
ncbi:hypothetical protein L6452_08691 [Arctium lappa]|uniref:Uncharacterized protein n=1 Tax=Arctium lappa TaxID=4217 RepID=A0ACB9DIA8_ARCLA|nr:hypothetical protein L6452_08691 [Arctium lappa]